MIELREFYATRACRGRKEEHRFHWYRKEGDQWYWYCPWYIHRGNLWLDRSKHKKVGWTPVPWQRVLDILKQLEEAHAVSLIKPQIEHCGRGVWVRHYTTKTSCQEVWSFKDALVAAEIARARRAA